MGDIEAIAREIPTKTIEEVQEYFNVFMMRFRELKEKDLVLQRIQKKDFEERNLETIRDFDISKNYALLLQENHFVSINAYLAMIERAHNKMVAAQETNHAAHKGLQLKIDHFFHS